jgi:hypothetical protein
MRKNRYLSPPKEIPPHHQSENLQNRNEPNILLYTRSRTPQTLDPSNKTLRQSLNTQLACTYRSQPLNLEREQGCFTKLAAEKKKYKYSSRHPDPTEEFPGSVADTHGCIVDLLGGDS